MSNSAIGYDPLDTFTVPGLRGHWHRTLEPPHYYQHMNWYVQGQNPNGIYLNVPGMLIANLKAVENDDLYLYTQHEIFWDQDVLKHTRSSPNLEGGLVTYATCKHLMRTYSRPTWVGTWLVGLCPKECASNTMFFAGRVSYQFSGNYALGGYVRLFHPRAYKAKRANTNPRGDLYTPTEMALTEAQQHDHRYFQEPPNHTRSLEFYSKSPGSGSNRPDGKIPKWWRDLEYLGHGRRPPAFVLDPCYLFSRPLLWTSLNPRRAVLRLTAGRLAETLRQTA